jgi:hypothetical protein
MISMMAHSDEERVLPLVGLAASAEPVDMEKPDDYFDETWADEIHRSMRP